MKNIILKYEKSNSLIWIGLNKKNKKINEEPLTLNFDNQEYYFYSSKILWTNKNWSKNWLNFENKVNSLNQEQIINKFSKIIYKENFDYQIILLELKFKVLKNNFKGLNKNFKNLKDNFKEIKNQNQIIINQINFLDQNIMIFKLEFLEIKNEIKLLNLKNKQKETKNYEKIKKEIIKYQQKFDFLLEKWSELSENFENLRKKIQENQEYLEIQNKISENNSDKNLLQKRLNSNNKAIFLTNNKNKSLVWIGTNEKPEILDHQILNLNFDNQEYYFYPSGITSYNYNWSKVWIRFQTHLNNKNQKKIIEGFDKIRDKTNLYHQSVYLKIKIEFLLNKFKILSKNLEQKSYKEINHYLNNKIKFIYKKILYFNKNNNLEKINSLFNKKIVEQIINNIKLNEQNNKTEIISKFHTVKINDQKLKEKIITLEQKINELNKNFNLLIYIFSKLKDYKDYQKIKFPSLSNINQKIDNILYEETALNANINSQKTNQEVGDNTNKPSTSFDLLNETIIKQESPENLTDDIFIESEIEFNDHINNQKNKIEKKEELSYELQEFIIDYLDHL